MLRGEKVLLRAVEERDLEQLWRWRTDLELWLATDDRPPTPLSYAQFQAGHTDRQADPDAHEFAIEADGQLIGRCAMFGFDHASRHASIGIAIGDREYWGRGHGRDAVGVLLDYGFRKHNLHRVVLNALAGNERALRAYRAVGFVEEGRLREHAWVDGGYHDVVYMGILRDEWLAADPARRARP